MRRARGLLPELHGAVARGEGLHAAGALPGRLGHVAQWKLPGGAGGGGQGGGRRRAWRPRRGAAPAARPGAARVHVGGVALALAPGGPAGAPLIPVRARRFLGEAVARGQGLGAVVPPLPAAAPASPDVLEGLPLEAHEVPGAVRVELALPLALLAPAAPAAVGAGADQEGSGGSGGRRGRGGRSSGDRRLPHLARSLLGLRDERVARGQDQPARGPVPGRDGEVAHGQGRGGGVGVGREVVGGGGRVGVAEGIGVVGRWVGTGVGGFSHGGCA